METRTTNRVPLELAALVAALLWVSHAAAAAEDAVPVKKAAPARIATIKAAEAAPENGGASESAEGKPAPSAAEVYLLTAEEVVALALENSYELRLAEKDAESAYFEYVKYAGMAGLSVDLQGGLSRAGPLRGFSASPGGQELVFQKETSTSLAARFSYPITPLGNLGFGKRAAWAGYQARRAGVDQARAEAIAGALSAYARCLTARNAVTVAEEGLALAEEQLRNAKLKYEHGIAPRFEAMQGEVAVSQAREELIKARNGYELARSALYLTIGIRPEDYFADTAVEVEYPQSLDRSVEYIATELFPRLDAEQLAEAFAGRTPQYHALEGKLGMLENQVFAYRRAPQFSLTGGYQQQTGSSFQARYSWSVGISGVLNLWDSGKTEGTQKSFAAQAEGARIEMARYRQAFRLSILDAVSSLEAAIQGHATARQTLAAAEEALRMARLGYREGVIPHADLVGARTAYLGAELNEFDRRIAVLLSFHSLLRTLGVGSDELYLPTTTSDVSALVHEVAGNASG